MILTSFLLLKIYFLTASIFPSLMALMNLPSVILAVPN